MDNVWVVEYGEQRVEQSPVFVVRDSTAVVTLSRQVQQRVERHLIILVQKHLGTDSTNSLSYQEIGKI